jgi:hypothetical protein
MPFEFQQDLLSKGFAMQTALDGEVVVVQTKGFYNLDNPTLLLKALDGVFGELSVNVPEGKKVLRSGVQTLVATYDPDKKVAVWLNELQFSSKARAARPIEAGQAVSVDDITDVESIDLGIEIPPASGVVVIARVGWEPVLFFDFEPLTSGLPRTYDVGDELGRCWTYVFHRQRLGISDSEWSLLFEQEWFPFILIPAAKIDLMLGLLRAGKPIDAALDDIAAAVEPRLKNLAAQIRWTGLMEHRPFFEKAVEHYFASDWISAISVLSPRIEGVIRSLTGHGASRAGHKELVASVVEAGEARLSPTSPILAGKFKLYLNATFFAPFSAEEPGGATRHPVTHGIAPANAFDRKHALLCFLIFHQLTFFAEHEEPAPNTAAPGGASDADSLLKRNA